MGLKDKFQKYSSFPLVVTMNNIFSFIDFDQIPYLDLTAYEGHENLSAFILYYSTQVNGKVRVVGKLVPKKTAKFPLTENEIEFIRGAF